MESKLTQFLQVKDNAYTRAVANSLNNTTSPVTLSGVNTTKFDVVTTGYIVTIWDDITYKNPDDDPNMEQALVTAATIGTTGSLQLTRSNPKSHMGTPMVALLSIARHITDITTAINQRASLVDNQVFTGTNQFTSGIILADANAALWQVTINTDGSLQSTLVSSGGTVPAGAFLDENNQPLLDELNNYILQEA